MKKSYAEKLKDPRWQQKRLLILQRDDWTCRICLNKNDTLNVHHAFYRRGLDPWEYPDHTLFTLCETCHSMVGRVSDIVSLQICEARQCNCFSLLAKVLSNPTSTKHEKIVDSVEALLCLLLTRPLSVTKMVDVLSEFEWTPEDLKLVEADTASKDRLLATIDI